MLPSDHVPSAKPDDAVLNFTTAPATYQQIGFEIACAAALVLLIAIAFYSRIEQIKRRYRQRMRDRHAERERIARDLHDTLLQGIQSLLFRLQNWETDPALPPGYREEVAAVVTQVRSIVIEGRDRILMLRRTDAQPTELLEALSVVGPRESNASSPEMRISMIGDPRPVKAVALEQLSDIGREAVRNSLQHAKASCVCVSVEYRRRSLILQIRDDGIGIDPSILRRSSKSRHFGITGMCERVEQLGGRIRIQRLEPHGTQVEVVVPARAAFQSGRSDAGRDRCNVTAATP